jgi:hypothetical protein
MELPSGDRDSFDRMLTAGRIERDRMQRRKWLLSILGPVIILLSFLVKDVFRDHVEAKIADFKEALTLLKQQSLLMDGLAEQIADVKKSVEGLSSTPQDNSVRPTVLDWRKQYDDYDRMIRELQVIHEDMPAALRKKDALEKIETAQRQTSDENQKFMGLIGQLRALINPTAGLAAPTAAQIQAKQQELQIQSGKVYGVSHGVYQLLIDQITSAKDRQESLHTQLNVISYVLFLLGWSLTLLGNFFHIPEPARGSS